MKTSKLLSLQLICGLSLGLSGFCSWASLDKKMNQESHIFVGCTPADSLIKTQLGIPLETKVDFIRWDLIHCVKSLFK